MIRFATIFFVLSQVLAFLTSSPVGNQAARQSKNDDIEKLLVGKWEEVGRIINGNNFPARHFVEEFTKEGKYTESNDPTASFEWMYYPKTRIIILHEKQRESLFRYKLLSVTGDSLKYTMVTINGIVEGHFIRLRDE